MNSGKKEPLDHCTSSVCAKTYYGGGGEKACTVASQPVLEKSFVFLYKHHYPLTLTSAFTTAVFLCYFSDDIRAAVACCGVLILLRTNARFNHCLQNVKTYIENTKLLKQPPKESSQVRFTLDLLFRLASAQDSLDCTVAPRPGWGMRQKTQEHTHRNKKQTKPNKQKNLILLLPGARSCSLRAGLHTFSDLCHHPCLVYTQRHTCMCK